MKKCNHLMTIEEARKLIDPHYDDITDEEYTATHLRMLASSVNRESDRIASKPDTAERRSFLRNYRHTAVNYLIHNAQHKRSHPEEYAALESAVESLLHITPWND